MAHIALYRTWRSQLFRDVVGQKHITQTLQNSLREQRFTHAYLFSGPRGTGKTSTAKIFAKAVNCMHGPAEEPCNECSACIRITQGAVMDVIEIDAASNRGVEEIRDIRDKVKYAPTEVRYKVYIIDEVHMLTTEAFNALLKTLEEPRSMSFLYWLQQSLTSCQLRLFHAANALISAEYPWKNRYSGCVLCVSRKESTLRTKRFIISVDCPTGNA
ncbi:DNA polymerase III subunit gamma/tau [Paenibacillus larvae]|nr:DNA polymerase III subunit gamma/tau [Paenibacillus larvae]MDT2246574.1 DNA polymerase III subunit gamma/tau [Paenibacillus larvae]